MTALATRHGDLWVRTFGEAPPAVVALHGFTQHGGMFEHLSLVSGISIAAPDLPGHGRTAVAPVSIRTAVDSVVDLLRTLPEPKLLLGYSQGGRVALQIALTHPELVESLVLVAVSPGLDERSRRIRRTADDGLAGRIERIGIERFITEWLANPLVRTDHIPQDRRDADRAMRLENTAEGLAAALRGMGQASIAESSDRIAALPMPVDFVAGTEDQKYAAFAAAMASSRSQRPVLVEGAGHNVVLDAPEALAAVISRLVE